MSNILLDTSEKLVSLGTEYSNISFANDFFRLFSIILTGVFAGYTLQPVPKWLHDLFDNSVLFKFLILLIIGLTGSYPIDSTTKFTNVLFAVILVLAIFEGFRYYQARLDKKITFAPSTKLA